MLSSSGAEMFLMIFVLRKGGIFQNPLTFLMKIDGNPEILIFPMEYLCF